MAAIQKYSPIPGTFSVRPLRIRAGELTNTAPTRISNITVNTMAILLVVCPSYFPTISVRVAPLSRSEIMPLI